MKHMFNKTLIAVALAAASTTAFAGTFAAAETATVEYAEINPVIVTGTAAGQVDVVLTTAAAYIENDVIEFTVSGASFDTSAGWAPAVVATGGGAASFIDIKAGAPDTLRFRVSTNIPSGETITLNGVQLDLTGVTASSEVTVSSKAISINQAIGEYDLTAASPVLTFADQFTATIDQALDENIDVSNNRNTFEAAANSDTLELTLVNNTTPVLVLETDAAAVPPTALSYSGTLTGSFGPYIDTDGANPGLQCAFLTGAVVTVCENDSITFDLVPGAETLTLSVAAANAGDKFAIAANDFGLSISAEYDPDTATADDETTFAVLSGANAGEWTLNGSQINVAYVPYRSDISQIINLTNRSDQDGAVSVTAYAEDGTVYDLGEVATASANSISRIGEQILQGLSTATGVDHRTVGSTTRYGFEIVTNAPADSIEVYSAYNVGGSGARLVVNSSNGKSEK